MRSNVGHWRCDFEMGDQTLECYFEMGDRTLEMLVDKLQSNYQNNRETHFTL